MHALGFVGAALALRVGEGSEALAISFFFLGAPPLVFEGGSSSYIHDALAQTRRNRSPHGSRCQHICLLALMPDASKPRFNPN